jgi:adenylate cyclase
VLEIERKFLVERVPFDLDQLPHTVIAQGYVALSGKDELRIRQRAGNHTLTIKRGSGRSRVEEEVALSEGLFGELWPLTEGRRVYKVRYEIRHDNLVIELDKYERGLLGLMTAEVEFKSEAEAHDFDPPTWLGREVTDASAYKNRALAERSDQPGWPGL